VNTFEVIVQDSILHELCISVIDLQREKNTNYHQYNLPKGIDQLIAELVFSEHFLKHFIWIERDGPYKSHPAWH
jgi:hypothetical protein